MIIVKLSPGVEELHRPVYLRFEQNNPVEVPEDVGQALVKRADFLEIKQKVIEFDNVVREHKKRRK